MYFGLETVKKKLIYINVRNYSILITMPSY